MNEVLSIVLPDETDSQLAKDLAQEIGDLEGVLNAGTNEDRFLEVGTLMVWLTASSAALGLAKTALDLINGVIDIVQKRGVKGVTIELPNGGKIAIDHASMADIKNLVETLTADQTG